MRDLEKKVQHTFLLFSAQLMFTRDLTCLLQGLSLRAAVEAGHTAVDIRVLPPRVNILKVVTDFTVCSGGFNSQ